MRRVVFLVEGDTEVILVNKFIIPYFYGKGYMNPMHAQKIISNRKLHKKGGNVNYQYLVNDLNNIFSQGNVLVTTFLDFFRLPTSFPGYTTNSQLISQIEAAMLVAFDGNPNFVPYIQRHEMEALFFSDIAGFEFVVDDEESLAQLQNIISLHTNPEDINGNATTAPSKRCEGIFNYDKTADAESILDMIGLDVILSKCPRFKTWMEKIDLQLKSENQPPASS